MVPPLEYHGQGPMASFIIGDRSVIQSGMLRRVHVLLQPVHGQLDRVLGHLELGKLFLLVPLFSLYPFSPCNSRRFVLYIRILKCVERENSGMNSSEKGGRRLKAALEEIRLVRPGAAPERGTA